MFRKLHEFERDEVTIEIDGMTVPAQVGETLASVILRQPEPWTRVSPVSGDIRAPYCMMGVCFECMAEVDGVGSVQTCLTPVSEGMRVARQSLTRRIGH